MDSNFDIVPIGTNILVETEAVEEKTDGGIIIPEIARQQQELSTIRGQILAVGDNAFCDLAEGSAIPEEGDLVYMARYAGMKLDDKNLRLCEGEDIRAVIRSKK